MKKLITILLVLFAGIVSGQTGAYHGYNFKIPTFANTYPRIAQFDVNGYLKPIPTGTGYLYSNGAGGLSFQSIDLSGYATQSWVSSNFDNYIGFTLSTNSYNAINVASGSFVNFKSGSGVSMSQSNVGNIANITSTLDIYGLTTITNPQLNGFLPYTATGLNSKITLNTLLYTIGTTAGTADRAVVRNSSGDAYAHNFILSSDSTLKKNIRPLFNTDWTNKIQFKQFEFKDDPAKKVRYGVIAQDIEKLAPELVTTDSEGKKAVAYIDLLIAKIVELENRIKVLESKTERITTR